MFALDGVGVLWAHPRVQDGLQSIKRGGQGTHQSVSARCSLPELLEAGTQNAASIISLHKAIDFIESIGIDRINQYVAALSMYLAESLKNLPGIEFVPEYWPDRCPRDNGIVTFRFEQVSSSDLAFALAEENIEVRAGELCQNKRGKDGFDLIRVSLHVYNTQQEVDRLIAVLRESVS
jgi:cysteine desulfurase/selenocysteine lyase